MKVRLTLDCGSNRHAPDLDKGTGHGDFLTVQGYELCKYSIDKNRLKKSNMEEALKHYNQIYVRDIKGMQRLDENDKAIYIHNINMKLNDISI